MDKDENHLAFIGCGHNENVPLYNSDNDRELSSFYEFVSNLESSALSEYFKIDNELENKVTWATAIFITDKNSQVIYETKPL